MPESPRLDRVYAGVPNDVVLPRVTDDVTNVHVGAAGVPLTSSVKSWERQGGALTFTIHPPLDTPPGYYAVSLSDSEGRKHSVGGIVAVPQDWRDWFESAWSALPLAEEVSRLLSLQYRINGPPGNDAAFNPAYRARRAVTFLVDLKQYLLPTEAATLLAVTDENSVATALAAIATPQLEVLLVTSDGREAAATEYAIRQTYPEVAGRFRVMYDCGAGQLPDWSRGRADIVMLSPGGHAPVEFGAERALARWFTAAKAGARIWAPVGPPWADHLTDFISSAHDDMGGLTGILRAQLPNPATGPHLSALPSVSDRSLVGKRVLVAGSNLGGCVAALELQRRGAQVMLTDKLPFVGRTCSTFELEGCRIDLGEHLFPIHEPRAVAYWHGVLNTDEFLPMVYNHGWYVNGRLTPAIRSLPQLAYFEGADALEECLESKKRAAGDSDDLPKDAPESLRQAIRSRGRWWVERYLETHQRRRARADWDAIAPSALSGVLNDLHQSDPTIVALLAADPLIGEDEEMRARRSESFGWLSTGEHALMRSLRVRDALLAREFDPQLVGAWYPRLGCGQMTSALAERLAAAGGQVRTRTELLEIVTDARHGIARAVRLSGEEAPMKVDAIVGTDLAELAKAGGYASDDTVAPLFVIFVAVIFEGPPMTPYTTILNHDPQIPILRVTDFTNWSPSHVPAPDRNALGVELRHSEFSPLTAMAEQEDAQVVESVRNYLEEMGVATQRHVLIGARVIRVPKRNATVPNELSEIPNIYPLTASNLGGTTRMGLELAEQVHADLSR